MKAIYTTVNNRKTFLGKHINNTIIREFPFSKAVLWQSKNLGFDKRLLEYAKENKVKQLYQQTYNPPTNNDLYKILNDLVDKMNTALGSLKRLER